MKSVANSYIGLTKIMKNDLIELGIPEEKIKLLPNGVDVNIFRPFGEKKNNLVLFVGRVCFQQRVLDYSLLEEYASKKVCMFC